MRTWHRFAVGTAIASLIAFANMARFGQVQPRMMGDELIYSQNLLLRPMAEITHPNFLYQVVYQPVTACGDNFYLCSKWINTGFLLVFAGALYLLAASFSRRIWAVLVAIAVAVGPVAIYSSLFTPDMMFFALCSLTIWAYAVRPLQKTLLNWLLVGSLLSLALLTKPHALILLPALVLAEFVVASHGDWRTRLKSAIAPATVGISALVVKLGIGFAAAGVAGLGIFGGAYENALDDNMRIPSNGAGSGNGQGAGSSEADFSMPILDFLSQSLLHAGFAIVFFGVLLAQSVRLARRENTRVSRLAALTLTSLLFGALMSSIFVAMAPAWGENLEGQVMVRYYEYAIWLLPITGLAGLQVDGSRQRAKKLNFVGWLVVAVLAAYWLVASSRPLFTDGSVLGLAGSFGTWLLVVMALVSLVMLTVSIVSRKSLANIWLVGIFPIITLTGWLGAQQQVINPGLQTNPYIESAVWIDQNLKLDDYRKVVFVGLNQRLLQTTEFWARDLDAVSVVNQPGEKVKLARFEPNTLVVLIDRLDSSNTEVEVLHEEQFYKVVITK